VRIEIQWNANQMHCKVLDRGSGIAEEVQQRLGRELITTRDQGHGMGVVLAYAALERYGGSLRYSSRPGGGTAVEVELSLAALAPPAP